MPPAKRPFPSSASWAGRLPWNGGRVTPRQRMAAVCAPFVAGRGEKYDELRNRGRVKGTENAQIGANRRPKGPERGGSKRANGAGIAADPIHTGRFRRRFPFARAPQGSTEGCVARRSRRHPVPSGGEKDARHLSCRPGGSETGNPVGALRFIWPQSGRDRTASIHAEPEVPACRWRACRCSSAGRAPIRRSSRTCWLQGRAVFATASKLSGLTVPVRV